MALSIENKLLPNPEVNVIKQHYVERKYSVF